MVEYLWQVDWDDNVIGKIERNECHEKKLIHRAIVVLVFNKKGYLWVNRRSTKKRIFSGCLDSSVAGHMQYGETPEICAQKELKEELGIEENLSFLFKIKTPDNIDNMIVSVFKCVTDKIQK